MLGFLFANLGAGEQEPPSSVRQTCGIVLKNCVRSYFSQLSEGSGGQEVETLQILSRISFLMLTKQMFSA